jgi:hypothetical protein
MTLPRLHDVIWRLRDRETLEREITLAAAKSRYPKEWLRDSSRFFGTMCSYTLLSGPLPIGRLPNILGALAAAYQCGIALFPMRRLWRFFRLRENTLALMDVSHLTNR